METPEYYERIDSAQGNYIITPKRDFERLLCKKPVTIGFITFCPGDRVMMYGFFNAPVEYCGMLDGNKMVFYLGIDHATLFSEGFHYYDITYRFTNTRIGKSYKAGTFRDRFLRVKDGKFVWK